MSNPLELTLVDYSKINAKQKEAFNYQKLSALLADYGLITIKLSDDWNGADFLAVHYVSGATLKVQLKSRLSFWKKYVGKDLWISFRDGDEWYLFRHDVVLECLKDANYRLFDTKSWVKDRFYTFKTLTPAVRAILRDHNLLPSRATAL